MSDTRMVTVWAKSWYTSKTLWVAVATILIGVLSLQEVRAVIPEEWLPPIVAVIGVLNLFLRFITNAPLDPPISNSPVKE